MTTHKSPKDNVLQCIDSMQGIMIAVSTGGPKIQAANGKYQKLYQQLTTQLTQLGIENTIPYTDLGLWYGKWSSGDLPTYDSRRVFISKLFGKIKSSLEQDTLVREIEITGWPRVDRALDEMRTRLKSASTEEQFQSIGHLCREILTSLAQIVFDPERHSSSSDDIKVSKSDAKGMLERYLQVEISGGENKQARKYAKASLDLANKLQHNRNANQRDAMLCAEATSSVVNFIAIISGKRDSGAATENDPSIRTPPPF